MGNQVQEQAPGRRERVREATREEIKAHARRQMAASGTAALALNAIAREMGMVPSALYRYYPDRDALITALILDAFAGLAAALRAADDGSERYGARLLATTAAYRSWALANPVDFQLVFGTPIPGYEAPAGQTGPAMQRVFGVFLDIIAAAHRAGQLRPAPYFAPSALLTHCEGDPFAVYTPEVMYSGLAGWTTMHGVVALELVGHLPLSDPARFFTGQIATYLDSIGLGG